MSNDVTGHLTETPIDYFDGENAAIEISENTIERLTVLANQASALEVKITEMSVALAEEQEELVKIKRVLMPNIMEELQLKEFKMIDGRTITIDPKVNASIKVEDRPAAFLWMEKNDYDGIIKTKVESSFGKGEYEDAIKAQQALNDAGFLASLDRSVHPATLTSFVKERLAAGDVLPECIGVFEFKEAKIKNPKVSKPKK